MIYAIIASVLVSVAALFVGVAALYRLRQMQTVQESHQEALTLWSARSAEHAKMIANLNAPRGADVTDERVAEVERRVAVLFGEQSSKKGREKAEKRLRAANGATVGMSKDELRRTLLPATLGVQPQPRVPHEGD